MKQRKIIHSEVLWANHKPKDMAVQVTVGGKLDPRHSKSKLVGHELWPDHDLLVISDDTEDGCDGLFCLISPEELEELIGALQNAHEAWLRYRSKKSSN